MIQFASPTAVLLLQCGLYILANASDSRSSSSSQLRFNDDSQEAWHQHWSSQNVYDNPSMLEDHLTTFSLLSDPTDVAKTSSMPDSDYKVDLSPDRYWQKYQEALSNQDAIKANKNKEKYDILVNDDYQGMNRLVDDYDWEYRQIREENVNHRSKAGWNRTLSKQWGDLACALVNGHYEPIGMQMDRSIGTSDEIEREQRNELYALAQEEASLLVHHWPLADFNLIKSEDRVEDKKDVYRSNRTEQTKRKWKKAVKLHNHRINALMHRSADDANALALYYGDKRIEHKKALALGEEREDRVRSRRNAWRDRADETGKSIKR